MTCCKDPSAYESKKIASGSSALSTQGHARVMARCGPCLLLALYTSPLRFASLSNTGAVLAVLALSSATEPSP